MTKITYNACRDNMGEVSDAEYINFKNAVAAALESEFHDAEIRVVDSTFANASQIDISVADIDRNDVETVTNRVFESGSWFDAA